MLKVVDERICQSPVPVALRRMYHHPRRLVDDQQTFVLIDDIQGNILGNDLRIPPWLVHEHLDIVKWLDAIVGLDRFPVHQDGVILDSLLNFVAGDMGDFFSEKFVNPHRGLAFVHQDSVAFKQF